MEGTDMKWGGKANRRLLREYQGLESGGQQYYIILLQAARTDSIYLCSDSLGTVLKTTIALSKFLPENNQLKNCYVWQK